MFTSKVSLMMLMMLSRLSVWKSPVRRLPEPSSQVRRTW